MVECTRLLEKSGSFISLGPDMWRDQLHLGQPHQQSISPTKPLWAETALRTAGIQHSPSQIRPPRTDSSPAWAMAWAAKPAGKRVLKKAHGVLQTQANLLSESTCRAHPRQQHFLSLFPLWLLIPSSLPDPSPGFPKLEVGLIPPYSPKRARSPRDVEASNALILQLGRGSKNIPLS